MIVAPLVSIDLGLYLSRKLGVVRAHLSVGGLHCDAFGLKFFDLSLDEFNIFLSMDGDLL